MFPRPLNLLLIWLQLGEKSKEHSWFEFYNPRYAKKFIMEIQIIKYDHSVCQWNQFLKDFSEIVVTTQTS